MNRQQKTRRDQFLFQLIFNLFGTDTTHHVEAKQMTNMEFYLFLVAGTTAMFALSFLIKLVIS